MRTLSTRSAGGADNFAWLRHAAALLVLWAHSYALSLHGGREPLSRLSGGFDAGRFAVYLFFAISGFLLAVSLQRNDSLPRNAWHRFLRIYPAYAVCLAVCVFGFGAAFTRLPLADYFVDAETWSYFVRNALPISMQSHLPGVFERHPFPNVVNASLWSLGWEIRWYAYFGVLALLGLFRRRALFTVFALVLTALTVHDKGLPQPDAADSTVFTPLFLLAALAALWRDRLPLSWRALAALTLLTVLLAHTRFVGSLLIVTCIYLVLCVAYRLPPLPPPKADWSYGLFLYGAPVQQSLVALWHDIPPLPLFALGSAGAIALAAASWRFVERPALHMREWVLVRAPGRADPAADTYQNGKNS